MPKAPSLESPEQIPRVEWSDFLPQFYKDWNQGEHVALVGPTGTGKTFLAQQLLPRRRNIAVLVTKPVDKTLDSFRSEGYVRLKSWPPKRGQDKVLVWPQVRDIERDVYVQQEVFYRTMASIFSTGKWCLFLDELRYVTETLRLNKQVELLWLQGRSIKISVVAATQRPSKVPLEMYDQSTHLFFWRDNDEANLKRLSGIGWLSSNLIRDSVARLAMHDVLYINTRTGEMKITRAERL